MVSTAKLKFDLRVFAHKLFVRIKRLLPYVMLTKNRISFGYFELFLIVSRLEVKLLNNCSNHLLKFHEKFKFITMLKCMKISFFLMCCGAVKFALAIFEFYCHEPIRVWYDCWYMCVSVCEWCQMADGVYKYPLCSWQEYINVTVVFDAWRVHWT